MHGHDKKKRKIGLERSGLSAITWAENGKLKKGRKRVGVGHRAGIFKLFWSPGIDSSESISPAFVAWRAGTTTPFLLGSWPP
jgi:hypothetical protein